MEILKLTWTTYFHIKFSGDFLQQGCEIPHKEIVEIVSIDLHLKTRIPIPQHLNSQKIFYNKVVKSHTKNL